VVAGVCFVGEAKLGCDLRACGAEADLLAAFDILENGGLHFGGHPGVDAVG